MKHCILVKFKEENKQLYPAIKELFNKTLEIEGIHSIVYKENCIPKDNRYHFLIEIEMDEEALTAYDESEAHKQWKTLYADYIEKKAIFDYN